MTEQALDQHLDQLSEDEEAEKLMFNLLYFTFLFYGIYTI